MTTKKFYSLIVVAVITTNINIKSYTLLICTQHSVNAVNVRYDTVCIMSGVSSPYYFKVTKFSRLFLLAARFLNPLT